MKVYFVRHGESTFNAGRIHQPSDSALSEFGKKQAEYVGIRLKNIDIDVFLSSPIPRARQTAEIINTSLNKEIIYTDFLQEIKHPSEFVGKDYLDPFVKEVEKSRFENADNDTWHYSDEENFFELKTRVKKLLGFLDEFEGKNILAVTHGNFLRVIFSIMMLGQEVNNTELEKIHYFLKTINTGITICEKEGGQWKLLTWNDHSHLG